MILWTKNIYFYAHIVSHMKHYSNYILKSSKVLQVHLFTKWLKLNKSNKHTDEYKSKQWNFSKKVYFRIHENEKSTCGKSSVIKTNSIMSMNHIRLNRKSSGRVTELILIFAIKVPRRGILCIFVIIQLSRDSQAFPQSRVFSNLSSR